MTLAFDSETELISAGNLAPRAACFTFCDSYDYAPQIVHAADAFEPLREMLKKPRIVGANTPYDAAVICSNFPRLLKDVFRAYRDGRMHDVQITQKLIDLSQGRLDGYYNQHGVYVKYSYSLSALHERYGYGAMAKGEDTWRLRYGELIPVPMDQWPEDAKKYALLDSLATLRVDMSQQAHEAILRDSSAQCRKAFALHLQSCRGMITDPRACEEFLEETKQEIAAAEKLIREHGLLRANGSKDTKAAKARMVQVCAELGIEPKKTAKDGISLDAEACRDSGDAVLRAYATYTSSNTAYDRAATLKKASTGIPLQTAYNYLVNNGRTSSRIPGPPLLGMNMQNLPAGGKMRECLIARPGLVLCSVDYTGCELHTFAQSEFWLTGKSRLGEALNEQRDAHCMIAATLLGCSYEEALANKKHGKYKDARQLGKIANFGFGGGMGAQKLMEQTNKRAKSKKERITLQQAQELRQAWFVTWDTKPYFDAISEMTADGSVTIEQFISGRLRGGCNFTEAANGFFSGLAADGMALALWRLADEAYTHTDSDFYGSYPLLCVHDEVIAEIPEDRVHEAAYRQRDIMVESMNVFTPDFPVRAAPAVFRRWYKACEETPDSSGRLQPGVPVYNSKGELQKFAPENEPVGSVILDGRGHPLKFVLDAA